MNSYILCGMQFGDEGKGTFVDYLAHENEADCIIRYNGGSHASHTVITPSSNIHKFSQLGSGMFLEKCHTYLTENMVVNLDNLMRELEKFSSVTNIHINELIDRIHIHEDCLVVTPYHKLINHLRELSKGDNRRGSVGTGVSEVKYLANISKESEYGDLLYVRVKDVFGLYDDCQFEKRIKALQKYVNIFYRENEDVILKNIPEYLKVRINYEIEYLINPSSVIKIISNYVDRFGFAPQEINLKRCIYSDYSAFRKSYKTAIFEGSQGLLIDEKYGIKPNTTFLDTTNKFAIDISRSSDNVTKIGVTKAFCSRHGIGIFPTESDELNNEISDENQDSSFWNGNIRFGWFDAVLLRYAQTINEVDSLYLSSIDKLDNLSLLKICNEYLYKGNIDEKFKDIFDYESDPSVGVIIKDIKKADDDLGEYLSKCDPIYISLCGWEEDTSCINSKDELPDKCLEYIKKIEECVKIPVSVISVGPTRKNKIRM